MESAVEQSLDPLLIRLNILHETWASSRSMTLLPLTSAGDRTSSSVWQPQEDTSVLHFIKENLICLGQQREFQKKVCFEKPKYMQKAGVNSLC